MEPPAASRKRAAAVTYRAKQKTGALDKAANSKDQVLAPLVIYSRCFDTTVIDEHHMPKYQGLVEFVSQQPVLDVLTGDELRLLVDDQECTLKELWHQHQAVPSLLMLAFDALNVRMDFGVAGHLDVPARSKLVVTDVRSFWKAVENIVGTPSFAQNHVGRPTLVAMPLQDLMPKGTRVTVVLLPELATAPEPSQAMLNSLFWWLHVQQLHSLPSVKEYHVINDKRMQYMALQRLGVPIIPYKVVTNYKEVPAAVADVNRQLRERTDLADFVQPATYVLKPIIAACSEGVFKFTVTGRKSTGYRLVEQHMEQISNPCGWLLQPFLPQMAKTEYKVFTSGDSTPMVLYQPWYTTLDSDSRISAAIYCPKDRIYSELFMGDGSSVSGASNDYSDTWHAPKLHNTICDFAAQSRKTVVGGAVDMVCADQVMLRVDVVALFKVVVSSPSSGIGHDREEDTTVEYDTDNPLLLVNEMHNLWSASLLADMLRPQRDSLVRMKHRGFEPAAERTSSQRHWVVGFRDVLLSKLIPAAVLQHENSQHRQQLQP